MATTLKPSHPEDIDDGLQEDYDERFNGIVANMGSDTSGSDDSRLNPAEQNYQRQTGRFNSGAASGLNGLEGSAAGTSSAGSLGNMKDIAKGESGTNALPNANALTGAATAVNPAAQAIGGAVSFAFGTNKRKSMTGGIVGLIIAVFGLTSSLGPPGILLNLKETGLRWATNEQIKGTNRTVGKSLKQRYFGDPDKCRALAVSCKRQAGIKDNEIAKLRKAGLVITDDDIGMSTKGTKYLKQFSYKELDGSTKVIDAKDFEATYRKSIALRVAMDKVHKGRSLAVRGPDNIRLTFQKYRIKRKTPIPLEGNDEAKTKAMRQQNIDDNKGKVAVNGDTESDKPAVKDQAGKLSSTYNKYLGDIDAIAAAEDYVNKGPSLNSIPDASNLLTAKSLVDLGTNTASSTVKGAAGGFLTTVDTACSVVQLERTINLTAKVLAYAQMIQFAGIFITVADKIKAGDATSGEVSFVAAPLIRKSVLKESKGLDFSNSPGYELMTQGKIRYPEERMRFSSGGVVSPVLNKISGVINLGGVSPKTCKFVLSPGGQVVTIGGGFLLTAVACVGTLGVACTGFAKGAVEGFAKGVIESMVISFVTPYLIQLAVGSHTPDLLKEPGGGFAIGTAIGSGIGLFGTATGRANSFKPLTHRELVALNTITDEDTRTMVAVDAAEDHDAGLFATSNPMSITNKLAMASTPILSSITSPSVETIGTFGSFIANTFAQLPMAIAGTSTTNAAGDDKYGSKWCEDPDYKELGIVTTGLCAPIMGPDAAAFSDDPIFQPDAVDKWMFDNGHIENDDDGSPKSDDLKDYIAACKEGDDPFTADGSGIDLAGPSTDQCVKGESANLAIANSIIANRTTLASTSSKPKVSLAATLSAIPDVKYVMFRAFLSQQSVDKAIDRSANDTLGEAETTGADAAATAPSATTANIGALIPGTPQELAKKIMASKNVSGDSRYMGQIQKYANGNFSCNINPAILAAIWTMAAPTDQGGLNHSIEISSLNRQCTGVITRSGFNSMHWQKKGGHAVDIRVVDGVNSTGATDKDIALIKGLAPAMPQGSRFGQRDVRAQAGKTLALPPGIGQIDDSGDHIHIDTPVQ
jgi:hypothetical protein